MSIFLILGLIFLLYLQTLNYFYIIDDNVKRNGYMYEVPLTQPPQEMYYQRPSRWYRLFMIGMHCVNTWIIYILWGWCPALLFAIHPMSAWGVAWVTGNYYATTAYFCLIAYYILHTFPNIWGALAAMPIFAAALNSTICCVSFPFLFLLTGNLWGCSLFIPLAIYLRGNRFTVGLGIRDSFKINKPLKLTFTYKRFALMAKVMAKYTLDTILPDKLGLFPPYGNRINDEIAVYNKAQAFNFDFYKSLFILLTVFIGGMFLSPVGIIWYFVVITLHSQWRMTGQFYAQRYVYCALPGLCLVAGALLQHHPIITAIVATGLFFRSFLFIPAFKHIECLYRNDIEAFPDNPQCYSSMAQFYINSGTSKQPLAAWRVNEIGSLLFKAEQMDPTDWAIKMNVACFFAMLNQWPMCLQKTTESLAFVKPLGGLPQPVEILEKQTKNVTEVMSKMEENIQANLPQVIEQQVKAMVDLVAKQNDPIWLPVSDLLKELSAMVEIKKEQYGTKYVQNISTDINSLINLIGQKNISADPDMVQISAQLKSVLEKRKPKGVANVSSPAQAQVEQKVGT